MMMRRNWLVLSLPASVMLIVCGCSGSGSVETNRVEGVVTLDGQPVPGATVTFVPVNEGQGMSATGVTDSEGKYTLTAVGGGRVAGEAGGGTLEGEYYVGVIKSETEGELTEEEAEEKGIQYRPSNAPSAGKITHVVPAKYNNPRESGIKVTVKKGDNFIPIELTSE